MRLLLDHGADVNHRQKNQDTPLTFAAWKGHIEIVRMLLDAGGDPGVVQSTNESPLTLAASKNHYDVVKLLLGRGNDINHRQTARARVGPICFRVSSPVPGCSPGGGGDADY